MPDPSQPNPTVSADGPPCTCKYAISLLVQQSPRGLSAPSQAFSFISGPSTKMPAAADEADAWMPGILICGLARRSGDDARKERRGTIDRSNKTDCSAPPPSLSLPPFLKKFAAIGTRVNGHLSEQQTERVAIMQWRGDTGKAKNTTCLGAWSLQTKKDL